MKRKWKLALVSAGALLLIFAVLWYPYESGVVPEWKIQVIDSGGHPLIGGQANQEWLDPIEDGITSADARQTDSAGFVVFPKRVLHNRLVLGTPTFPPAARVTVCGKDEFGDVEWEAQNQKIVTQLELKRGPCPYD